MRQILRNLSIRGKLLAGFGIIVLIMLFTGIRELMVLNNLNTNRQNTSKAIETAELLKESRFLLQMELGVINRIATARTEDQLSEAKTEHLQNNYKLEETLNLILNNTAQLNEAEYRKRNKLIEDSVYFVQQKYRNELTRAYRRVSAEVNKLININAYYNEHIKISPVDTLEEYDTEAQKDSLKYTILNQIEKSKEYITDESDELIKTIKSSENLSQDIAVESEKKTEEIFEGKANETFLYILGVTLVAILISMGISRIIISPIKQLQAHINILTKGELPDRLETNTGDEIGEMGDSLNKLVDNLKRTAQFSHEIGKGDFSTNFRPVSKKDVLGNSLLSMRDSLKAAKSEEEKRQTEDKQRGRTSAGLALFGDILRKHTDNLQEFADEIISNLVKFMEANQGALFLLNEENKENIFLDLIGAYAYNRKKYINKEVKIGEGLVGSVAEEKYTVYMTDVPNEYIEIESGIGSANPKSILIVPLKIEEQILGVIELASFNEFEPYEINLVEKIAESIASTLSTARINTRTAELLDQSEKATAMMREKEEEMRQNIEELQATQEESKKREKQLRKTLSELDTVQKRLKVKDQEQAAEIKKLEKQNQEQIREIQEKETIRKTIMDSSINAILLLNNRFEIELFNKAAERHFGYSEEEVIGKTVSILFKPEMEEEEADKYLRRNFLSKGKEALIYGKEGKEVPVFYSVKDFTHLGSTKYSVFLKNIKWEKDLEKQRTELMEQLMANEFENEIRIEKLEELLSENNIKIPEEKFDKELIKWTDKLSIGINIIDQQHKRWLQFINKLYSAFKSGKAQEEIKGIFKELSDYTDYHFEFEEKYMEEFDYSSKEPHRKKHRLFLDTINKYREDYERGNIDTAYRVMGFLKNWVRKHITEDDESYSALFKKNGLN